VPTYALALLVSGSTYYCAMAAMHRAYYGTANGSPDSSWVTLQLDWLPFNKNGGPSLWSWFNPKMSAQYIAYSRFDGTTSGASDNDTFYLQAWLVF
jgi:hypothetical protein